MTTRDVIERYRQQNDDIGVQISMGGSIPPELTPLPEDSSPTFEVDGEVRKDAYDASMVFTAFSNLGYKNDESVCDIIDNAIEADAKEVAVITIPSHGGGTLMKDSQLFVADDGVGMDRPTLVNALDMGTNRERNFDGKKSLGEFGMGMKTASFSIGQNVIVLTAKQGKFYIGQTGKDLWSKQNSISSKVSRTGKKFSELQGAVPESLITALEFFANSVEASLDSFSGTIVMIDDIDPKKVGKKNAESFRSDLHKPLGKVFCNLIQEKKITIKTHYLGPKVEKTTEVTPVTLRTASPKEKKYIEHDFGAEDVHNKTQELPGFPGVRYRILYYKAIGHVGKKKGEIRRPQGVEIYHKGRLMNYHQVETFGAWVRNDMFMGFTVQLYFSKKTEDVTWNVQKARPCVSQALTTRIKEVVKNPLALVRAMWRKSTKAEEGNSLNTIAEIATDLSQQMVLPKKTLQKHRVSEPGKLKGKPRRGSDVKTREPRGVGSGVELHWVISTEEFYEEPEKAMFRVKAIERVDGKDAYKLELNDLNPFVDKYVINSSTKNVMNNAMLAVIQQLALLEVEMDFDPEQKRFYRKFMTKFSQNLVTISNHKRFKD